MCMHASLFLPEEDERNNKKKNKGKARVAQPAARQPPGWPWVLD